MRVAAYDEPLPGRANARLCAMTRARRSGQACDIGAQLHPPTIPTMKSTAVAPHRGPARRQPAAAQGARGDVQSGEPLPPRAGARRSTTAGRCHPTGPRGTKETPRSPKTTVRIQNARTIIARNGRPTCRSRSRSIRTAAASTAASTATRGPRTRTSTVAGAGFRDTAVRQDQRRRAAAPRDRASRLPLRADRAGRQHRPYQPIEREYRIMRGRCSRCSPSAGTRSPS